MKAQIHLFFNEDNSFRAISEGSAIDFGKYDGTETDIFGWVEKETFGPDAGKYRAGHPTYYDPETDTDAVCLGVFNTLAEAQIAVLQANHPAWGIPC